MRKTIWTDPVWAAVIAGVVLAGLGWLWGKLTTNEAIVFRTLAIPIWVIVIFVFAACGAYWRFFSLRASQQNFAHVTYNFPTVLTLLSVDANLASPDLNLTHPLKCSVFLRNDSKGCVDIALANYERDRIPMKTFTSGVLQIEVAGRGWVPDPHGADQIAVLPNQNVKLWIPIDEKKYTPDEVRGSRNQIGTLILNANGRQLRIKI